MNDLKFWYGKFSKSPMGVIAFALLALCVTLSYKLVDIYKSSEVKIIEQEKIIKQQNDIILDLATEKTKYKTIVDLNYQLKQAKKK